MTKIPNFFIIGGPKCGTTALAYYLKEHPDIFIPQVKEPHYFATDLYQFHEYYRKTETSYLQLFETVTKESAVGEASVFYAYSDTALANIAHYNPAAKIIFMVRNPAEVVYSLHAQYLYNGFDETVADFDTAWRLQESRAMGEDLPKKYRGMTDKSADMLQYRHIARFGEQYAKLKNHFPDTQIHLILFDDFKANNLATYQQVLNFLNIPYHGRTEFPKINQNTLRKASSLRHTAKAASMNPKLIRAWRLLKRSTGVQSFGIMNKIDTATTSIEKRQPLSETLRSEISLEFLEDIKFLEVQTNNNLSHWQSAKQPIPTH